MVMVCYVGRRFPPEYIGKSLFLGDSMPRGRTRTVTSTVSPLVPGAKMPAPPELLPAQAAIWDRIVGSLPNGWITAGSAPLAKELCRHIDFGDRLAVDIEAARSQLTALANEPADDVKAEARKAMRCRKAQAYLFALMRLHKLQSDAMGRLSTKLRLTKLSQYTRAAESAAIAARNASTVPEPWNDWRGGRRGQ
jgi:hypothetical protein